MFTVLVAHKGFTFHFNMLLSEVNKHTEPENFKEKIAAIFERNNILFADSLVHMCQVSDIITVYYV